MKKQRALLITRHQNGFDDYAFVSSFEDLGYDVVNIDDRVYVHHEVVNEFHRAARWLFRPSAKAMLNKVVIKYLNDFRPNILLAFKASWLTPEVASVARSIGCKTVLVYPDLPDGIVGKEFMQYLKLIDVFIHNKPNCLDDFVSRFRADSIYIPPLYDRRCVNTPLASCSVDRYVFVANYSKRKADLVSKIAPKLHNGLSIFGYGWPNRIHSNVQALGPLFGPSVRALQRDAILSLGGLSEAFAGSFQQDVITARSIQVPAYGGLLLHESNAWADAMYENPELTFQDTDDFAEKAERFAKDPAHRYAMALWQHEIILRKARSIQDLVKELVS